MHYSSPVNPNATDEARRLLSFLYRISGVSTLSGQHNTPRELSLYSDEAYGITGKYPAVWGQDFGFSGNGDMDGVEFRQAIIDEAKRQHAAGSIITLMWHAVRPTDDEPVTFEDNICHGMLGEADWNELTTPGTRLNDRWARQVDVIATYLTQLRDARIPVLWRPYHEMNGEWFWWGGRGGARGYTALYSQLYDRLVNIHALDNLLWVWNANAPGPRTRTYAECFPGHDTVDILAVDVYGNDFRQSHYDELVALADGKPVALGEVGAAPTPELLNAQPRWAWFMIWTNFLTKENPPESVRALYNSDRVVSRQAHAG